MRIVFINARLLKTDLDEDDTKEITMAEKRDYYEVLGVDKNADAGTLKRA